MHHIVIGTRKDRPAMEAADSTLTAVPRVGGRGPRERERDRDEAAARRADHAGAEAVHEAADHRHEGAVEEERERDDEGEGAAVHAQLGSHGLEERTNGEADPGGEEDDEREGPGDPPAVIDTPGSRPVMGCHREEILLRVLSFRHAFVRDPPRRVARRGPPLRLVLAAAGAALLVGGWPATAGPP